MDFIKIVERNARAFDLSDPLDAFNYATFLLMLATEHARKIHEAFKTIEEDFVERCKKNDDQLLNWTMAAQFPNKTKQGAGN